MPLTVVGLGPGSSEAITVAALEAMRAPGTRVVARTRLHPALDPLLGAAGYESLDHLYQQAADMAGLSVDIADHLQRLSENGQVVYAVPGDGATGDLSIALLRERGVPFQTFVGPSAASATLAAAGVTAVDGLQVVDAASLGGKGVDLGVEPNPRWPLVVTGVFNRDIASEVKLALAHVYPTEWSATVAHHPGLDDASSTVLPLDELDRGRISLDYLTNLYVPPVPTDVPTGSPHGLRAVVSRLRAPKVGCPWDLEQTHQSLIPFVIEETYEVVDAIQEGTSADLMEELGDLLLQVSLHAELADQDGDFDWNDVVRGISEKLIRRHPHVFGDVQVGGAGDVVRNWDQLKAAEKAGTPPPKSALAGISRSLPALKRASELARKASKAGFDWPERAGTVAKVREELAELLAAGSLAERREELGDLLSILAKLAWQDGVDPEEALRAANARFERRFREVEAIAAERGWESLTGRTTAELLDAWEEAKHRTAALPDGSPNR